MIFVMFCVCPFMPPTKYQKKHQQRIAPKGRKGEGILMRILPFPGESDKLGVLAELQRNYKSIENVIQEIIRSSWESFAHFQCETLTGRDRS